MEVIFSAKIRAFLTHFKSELGLRLSNQLQFRSKFGLESTDQLQLIWCSRYQPQSESELMQWVLQYHLRFRSELSLELLDQLQSGSGPGLLLEPKFLLKSPDLELGSKSMRSWINISPVKYELSLKQLNQLQYSIHKFLLKSLNHSQSRPYVLLIKWKFYALRCEISLNFLELSDHSQPIKLYQLSLEYESFLLESPDNFQFKPKVMYKNEPGIYFLEAFYSNALSSHRHHELNKLANHISQRLFELGCRIWCHSTISYAERLGTWIPRPTLLEPLNQIRSELTLRPKPEELVYISQTTPQSEYSHKRVWPWTRVLTAIIATVSTIIPLFIIYGALLERTIIFSPTLLIMFISGAIGIRITMLWEKL